MEMLGPARMTVVGGVPIAWTEMGVGAPVVLLHGLGDSHRTWRRAAPRLAERFRVLMPDLPGHGRSGRPDAEYTLEWYARTLLGWLDAVGVERTHLCGHSFGGGVAQWMVLEGRPRVERLVLVAPGGLGREVSLGLRLAAFPVVAPLVAQPFMGIGTHLMMRAASGADHEPHEVAELARLNRAPGTGLAFCRTVAGCIGLLGQRVQTWERIHEVESLPPIALLWGERDPILPIRHGVAAQARLEGAAFARYPEIAHFPHLQDSERFARDVLRFLDPAVSPATPRLVASTTRALARPRGRLARTFARLAAVLRAALLTPRQWRWCSAQVPSLHAAAARR